MRGRGARRAPAEDNAEHPTRVRWEHVSLFSAVNSLGQQIWLLVPFPICYKKCALARASAAAAPANLCQPRYIDFHDRSVLLKNREDYCVHLAVCLEEEEEAAVVEEVVVAVVVGS